jgi:hypothetical protein
MSIPIRDIEHTYSLWSGFRDELVATAMTLSLLVLGSFLLTERMIFQPESPTSPLAEVVNEDRKPETLGVQDQSPQTTLPTPMIKAASTASEGAKVFSEVPYGEDGDYDFDGYAISFRDPRITFDAETNTKRRLMVNVWMKNKNIINGLDMRLTASIIKDGKVIVPAAALHIPQPKRLGVNEEMSFAASISLIEGTDVRELKYVPGGGIVDASHFLYP